MVPLAAEWDSPRPVRVHSRVLSHVEKQADPPALTLRQSLVEASLVSSYLPFHRSLLRI